MSLLALEESGRYEVGALLTTVSSLHGRISMHGVRESLLEAQADRLGIPLARVRLPDQPDNEVYEDLMGTALVKLNARGFRHIAFGDIFLEDIRRYREKQVRELDMEAVFPLWGRETRSLARRFIDAGYRAVLTCVDSEHLDGDFAGREFDDELLRDLPEECDPCGENGEFHTFVYAGPLLGGSIPFCRGERVLRDGRFYFCDLISVSDDAENDEGVYL